MIFKGYIFGILYAALCLLLSLILYKIGLPKKYTRKVVHVLVGFEWVILYHFMGAGIHFLAVCVIFLLLLFVAYKGKLMPMISSDSDNAPGTVYYAVAMTGVALVGCFVPEIMLPFGIGVMCTSVGDGMAGVIGQLFTKNNPKIFGNKTLFGSLTNVILSSLSAFVISTLYSCELGIAACILIGILSAELELITPFGFDNISVTWGTAGLAYLLMYFQGASNYLLPILFTPVIIIFALSKKALTVDGIIAALLLDIAVSIAFKNGGFLVLCAFFVGSILIDKIKKRYIKNGRNDIVAKGECRDYMQVIANGLAALTVSIAFLITGKKIFIIAFVACMAEAFADTVASGIGAFSSKTYDPFRLRKCEAGISGGMSLIGTVSSFVAALIFGFIAYGVGLLRYGFRDVMIVVFAAFLGAVLDSLFGSLLQVKYKCSVCGAITEREAHCGIQTVRYSGFKIIDNDVVNLISSSLSAVIATFLSIVF